MIAGIILLIRSHYEPSIITPTNWNGQINDPEDVEPPGADKFQHYDPGDIVYIEGDISSIEFLSDYNETLIHITDNSETCAFVMEENFTNIDIGDHVFIRVEIIEPGDSGSSFVLSGDDPLYFGEEAILVDIEKEVLSFESIFLLSGIILIMVGIILEVYFLLSKKQIRRKRTEIDSESPRDE